MIDKGKGKLQLRDKEKEWVDINTNGENNRATRFDSHSLGDPTSDSDTSVEDYFMKQWESWNLEERKGN